MLEEIRYEAKREADLKYIKLFLENNWSIDKIKAKTKLDADYLNEIISEINSQKESN
jgi:hypothetical protein